MLHEVMLHEVNKIITIPRTNNIIIIVLITQNGNSQQEKNQQHQQQLTPYTTDHIL